MCSVGYFLFSWYNNNDRLFSTKSLIVLAIAVFAFINMSKHTAEEKEAIKKYGYLPDKDTLKKLERYTEKYSHENVEKESEINLEKALESAHRAEQLRAKIREQELHERYRKQIRIAEELARENERMRINNERATSEHTADGGFFSDISDDWEKIQSRYKALSKAFHPDMKAGNNERFQMLNKEYEKFREKYQPKDKE